MIEPPKPSTADLEAHARVEAYYRWIGHRFAVRDGRVTFVGYPEGMMIETEYGSEPMTDDVMREMGWTVARSEGGTIRYEKDG